MYCGDGALMMGVYENNFQRATWRPVAAGGWLGSIRVNSRLARNDGPIR